MVDLTGMAADVDRTQLEGLLKTRSPGAMDETVGQGEDLLDAAVRGVAVEVAAVVGSDPAAGPRRDLAVWAITVGAAAMVEAELYPEQRVYGSTLQERYAALMEQLQGMPEDGLTPSGDGVPKPRGAFPKPSCYPDPAERGLPGAGWVGRGW